MGERIELPQTPQGTAEEQMRQMYSYLYRVAEALNHNLSEIGSMDLTDEEREIMKQITAEEEGEAAAAYDWQGKESLKSLIIKTAAFVQNKLDVYRLNLLGEYVTEGKFGKYVRNTSLKVDVTPTGIQQDFTFEEVVQGLKNYTVNAKNYIKTGLLRTVSDVPVYGVAIGKDVVTFSEDGTETYNDGNKVAELTADELSFWQNGNKVASYTGNKISFIYGNDEVFYIENGKIYCAKDLTIQAGSVFKVIMDSENQLIFGENGLLIDDEDDPMQFQIARYAQKLTNANGLYYRTLESGAGQLIIEVRGVDENDNTFNMPLVLSTSISKYGYLRPGSPDLKLNLGSIYEPFYYTYCKRYVSNDDSIILYPDGLNHTSILFQYLTVNGTDRVQIYTLNGELYLENAHFTGTASGNLTGNVTGDLTGKVNNKTTTETSVNNIIDKGDYWINFSNITDGPTGLTGTQLLKVDTYGSSFYQQTIYTDDAIYTRRYLSSWGSWYKFTGTAV